MMDISHNLLHCKVQIFKSIILKVCAINGLDQCEFAQGPWEPQAPPGALSCHRDVNKRGSGGGSSFSPGPAAGFTPLIVCPIKTSALRENSGKNDGPNKTRKKHPDCSCGRAKQEKENLRLIF